MHYNAEKAIITIRYRHLRSSFCVQSPGTSRIFQYIGHWFEMKKKNPLLGFANNLQTLSKLLNHQPFPSLKFEYLSSVAYFELYDYKEQIQDTGIQIIRLFQIKWNMCYPRDYIKIDCSLKVPPIFKIFLSVQNTSLPLSAP